MYGVINTQTKEMFILGGVIEPELDKTM